MLDRTFARAGDGAIVATLHEREVQLLQWLARDLAALVEAPPGDDAVVARLFPHAYLDPTEENAEQQWQALVHPDLVRSRLVALDGVVRSLEGCTPNAEGYVELRLDAEQEASWLGVLNDARLAIGTAVGVTEEMDVDALVVDEEDPKLQMLRIYGWLSELQQDLVDVLLGEMPEAGDDGIAF